MRSVGGLESRWLEDVALRRSSSSWREERCPSWDLESLLLLVRSRSLESLGSFSRSRRELESSTRSRLEARVRSLRRPASEPRGLAARELLRRSDDDGESRLLELSTGRADELGAGGGSIVDEIRAVREAITLSRRSAVSVGRGGTPLLFVIAGRGGSACACDPLPFDGAALRESDWSLHERAGVSPDVGVP